MIMIAAQPTTSNLAPGKFYVKTYFSPYFGLDLAMNIVANLAHQVCLRLAIA